MTDFSGRFLEIQPRELVRYLLARLDNANASSSTPPISWTCSN